MMRTLELDPNDVEKLADGLEVLLRVQLTVSPSLDGHALEPSRANKLLYGYALQHEVGELLDVLGWKPWKANKRPNRERVLDEFADVLAFLGLIVHYLTQTDVAVEEGQITQRPILVDHLAQAYVSKSYENMARARGERDGYGQNDAD